MPFGFGNERRSPTWMGNAFINWAQGVGNRLRDPIGSLADAGFGLLGLDPKAVGQLSPEQMWDPRRVFASWDPNAVAGLGGVMRAVKPGEELLDVALEAEKRNLSPQKIFDATGMWRGPDQKWRTEIPDTAAQLTPKEGFPFLGPQVAHPEAYRAVPDLQQTYYRQRDLGPGVAARYSPDRRPGQTQNEAIFVSPNAPDPLSSTLHEMQHALQERGDLARGGSAEMFKLSADQLLQGGSEVDDITAALRRTRRYPEVAQAYRAAEEARSIGDFEDMARFRRIARQRERERAYKNLAGEVEARNVQTRMGFSPDYRRMLAPWQTEDVPQLQQTIFGLLNQ